MTQDEIQAVARAMAKAEGLDWDEVCPLEHDDNAECDSSTCIAAYDEDHDPEWARKVMLIKVQAAIRALDAARGKAKPVARVLTDPQRMLWKDDVEGICPSIDLCFEHGGTVRCWPCAAKQSALLGVAVDTAQPALPEVSRLRRELKAQGDRVAQVVEWLRKENGICDCHARCETECGCGAWDDWKTKPILQIADAIERGEPFNG